MKDVEFRRNGQPTHTQPTILEPQWQIRWQTIQHHAGSTYAKVSYGFIAGLFVGLVIFGWWLWPVEWTGGSFVHLAPDEKVVLVGALADLNSYDFGSRYVRTITHVWPESADYACTLALDVNGGQKMRLEALAFEVNGHGCN